MLIKTERRRNGGAFLSVGPPVAASPRELVRDDLFAFQRDDNQARALYVVLETLGRDLLLLGQVGCKRLGILLQWREMECEFVSETITGKGHLQACLKHRVVGVASQLPDKAVLASAQLSGNGPARLLQSLYLMIERRDFIFR